MFQRLVNPLKSNSFFLFGARGTGKSTWIQNQFQKQNIWYIDLLDPEEEDQYIRSPKHLEDKVGACGPQLPDWIVIDEIQRVPKLLDLVHRLIEKKKIKFILTGSSARKLKRGAANLLAGRAFVYHLYPLTTQELKDSFELNSVLNWGSLPKVQSLGSNAERAAYLKTYALTYLKEEVQSEQLVRKLEPFRLFLEVAAQCNAKILNFKKISNDVGVDDKTVFSYFQILEETWIGFFLQSYHPSIRKSQLSHPKFYFFDPGVIRALSRTLSGNIVSGTSLYGDAFEHWVILEIYRLNEYTGSDYRLSYFATKEGSEVDLVLDKPGFPVILIEIKSSTRVDEREVNKLARISMDFKNARVYYVSQDMNHLKIGSVICLHWQELLKELFQEELEL